MEDSKSLWDKQVPVSTQLGITLLGMPHAHSRVRSRPKAALETTVGLAENRLFQTSKGRMSANSFVNSPFLQETKAIMCHLPLFRKFLKSFSIFALPRCQPSVKVSDWLRLINYCAIWSDLSLWMLVEPSIILLAFSFWKRQLMVMALSQQRSWGETRLQFWCISPHSPPYFT